MVVVPIYPHRGAHRLDIESKCFQLIISWVVRVAFIQYVHEMNALDHL